MNFIPCRLTGQNGKVVLQISGENNVILNVPEVKAENYLSSLNRDVIMGIRPEYFSLVEQNKITNRNHLSLQVNVIEPLGSTTLFFCELAASEMVVSLEPIPGIKPGDSLNLKADMSKIHLFDSETGNVL
jgi:multiple sugar transport system ATP-binding protein